MIEVNCRVHGWQPAIILGPRAYCGWPTDCVTSVPTPAKMAVTKRDKRGRPTEHEECGGDLIHDAETRVSHRDCIPGLVPGTRYRGTELNMFERRRCGEERYTR